MREVNYNNSEEIAKEIVAGMSLDKAKEIMEQLKKGAANAEKLDNAVYARHKINEQALLSESNTATETLKQDNEKRSQYREQIKHHYGETHMDVLYDIVKDYKETEKGAIWSLYLNTYNALLDKIKK